jgi:non-ribosomal peptide synthetase component F
LVELELAPKDVADMDDLAARHGVTRFAVLAASFLGLVSLYTGSEGAATAVPVSGRLHPELEPVVGPVMNLVVISADTSPSTTMDHLVVAVSQSLATALSQQRVPYDELNALAPKEWESSPTGLVDSLVQLLPRAPELVGERHRAVPLPDPGVVTRFPLEILFEDRGTTVGLRLTYRTSTYEHTTSARFAEQLVALVRAATRQPGVPLATLVRPRAEGRDAR